MAGQALFAAQLLAGEMPQDIEEAFAAAGVSLFPDRRGDLDTDCSCPDWANPCKHVAATHYILGEQFDEDPFLLFRLRGRTQEQILAALRALAGDDSRASPKVARVRDRASEPEAPGHAPGGGSWISFWQPAGRAGNGGHLGQAAGRRTAFAQAAWAAGLLARPGSGVPSWARPTKP